MPTIYFRKILKYNPTFGNQFSKYEGYSQITLQQTDPSIEIKQTDSLEVLTPISFPVFASSLKRGQDTARKYFDENKIVCLEELREIKFDLAKLLTNEEYLAQGSNLVRQRFIEAFIKDDLREKRSQIEDRIKFLMEKFSRLDEGNYLAISHSFFMKIFEIYTQNNNLFSNPKIFKKYFDPNKKTFEFGEGFEFKIRI